VSNVSAGRAALHSWNTLVPVSDRISSSRTEPVVNGAAVLETAILGDFLLAIGSASDTTPVGRHENE